MPLPSSTTVLVVGAGPSGLSAALSLVNAGVQPQDILVVDAIANGENTSRAAGIHAATLEALDTLHCADDLVKLGIQVKRTRVRNQETSYLTLDYNSLTGYTRFPYMLLLSQTRTEEVLNRHLEESGVAVMRPFRVVGISPGDEGNGLNVSFESGEVVCTKYVIGADGARSLIRTLSNIEFSDPDGQIQDNSVAPNMRQVVLADVTFTDPGPPFPRDELTVFNSSKGMLLLIPLGGVEVQESEKSKQVYRIGFNVPLSKGPPPSHPPLAYIQEHLDVIGPKSLSSDPKRNAYPIEIEKVISSTRFRLRSAIAETFFKKVEGGIVMLVGDSAHIHSPVGGQGMNLGIRDAVGLGPVLAAYIKSSSFDDTRGLEEYTATRHKRALETIRTTKRANAVAGAITSRGLLPLFYFLFGVIAKIPFVTNMIVWSFSGLGRR